MERATFGGGCFWCVEAVFAAVEGVESVTAGYAGGSVADPSYREVCSGTTGHAEVVQLEYDPETVSYGELLEIFFRIHDPTTVDREGPDVGSQYRSIVLTHDEDQETAAERFVERLDTSDAYGDPIVTEIEPLETFYRAEERHQDYFEKNPLDAYCRLHATPKVDAVRQEFPELVDEAGPA